MHGGLWASPPPSLGTEDAFHEEKPRGSRGRRQVAGRRRDGDAGRLAAGMETAAGAVPGSSGEGTRDRQDGEGALGSAGMGMLPDAAPGAPPLIPGERRAGRKRRMLLDGICQNGGGEAGTLLLRISPGWRGCENPAFPEVTAGKG